MSDTVHAPADPRYDAVDLHCHSLHSDGALPIAELMARAQSAELKYFSVTDHDTLRGQEEAFAVAKTQSINYVSGVEWSAVWGSYLIHVVGLNFDLNAPASLEAEKAQVRSRARRARRIADKLEREGFVGVREWLSQQDDAASIGRPHIAAYLVESQQAKNVAQVFKRYLGAGKVGDVKNEWPELGQVVQWITAAGGQAVLAHPHRYKMTRTKRTRLVADFAEAGGQAIEIGVPGVMPDMRQHLVQLVQDHELAGSSGSDFHHDEQRWLALGKVPPLPKDVVPVWTRFRTT
ncbi:PHP domain-containing protein [Salinispirillum sp. LH 10-3-1]|uniref:PHP domain-containing protein n=1 Tax=Salinispirillum sp. LH 10-3-1 TaxID=2952525 RepID=A0AB38YBL8_9GAMM